MIALVRIGVNTNRRDQGLPEVLDRVMAGVGHLLTRATSAIYLGKVVDRVSLISSNSFLDEVLAADRGGGRSTHFKGQDYQTDMEITLEEAYHGTHRLIQLEDEKLRIATKPGVHDEQQLRIKGKGGKGSKENHGDLYVRVHVATHPRYSRKGDDLHTTHTIDLFTAVLGGYTIVDTMSGQVKVKIDPGTQNGKTIRIKSKGMPVYGKPNQFGDLYVQLLVHIPEQLTDRQRELFEQLKSTY